MSNIERVNKETFNIVEYRLGKMKEIFPEVFTEGKIDFDKLRESLGDLVDDRPERYLFTWAGKTESIRLLQRPIYATTG